MTKWRLSECDVFFLSYDETAAERHFTQLCAISPREPRRIHGVKGLHKAYATAAAASRTDRFISVDADSFVEDDTVFRAVVDDDGIDNLVFAFPARNHVNGLVYGNGSIKCWRKHSFDGLRTHECALPGTAQVDFHQVLPYRWLPQHGSINCFAVDPFHAFRGGYREAVKLAMGPPGTETSSGWPPPLSDRAKHRLATWVSVGMDVEHGAWAIYGARRGLIDYWIDQSLRPGSLSEFDYFVDRWRQLGGTAQDTGNLLDDTAAGMARLGLPERCLSPHDSIAFKIRSD